MHELPAAWIRFPLTAHLRRALIAASVALALALVAALAFWISPPSLWIDPARFARPRDAFEVLDRHGEVLRHARVDGVDRRWIALSEVSPTAIEAFLAVEDARFREHHGVDGRATLRAAFTLVRPWGRRSGGSTITQQLVKRVYGRPLGPVSKLLEIARAAALERVFGKDEILEQYLNRVPFGDRIEGVARASEEYFGKPASALDVAEAALLAGIPQAPSATEPRRHPARARARRDFVLARLVAVGRLDEDGRRRAAADPPRVRAVPARPDQAPRFVDAALSRWRDGRLDRDKGALSTSLDLPLQRRVEEILAGAVARHAGRGVTNAAAIVTANGSGEILAYVGAVRGADVPGASLDLLLRARQPGSTLKPFAYELLFEKGGTAASVLDDISLPRLGARGELFEAHDYDGHERGPVRARAALAGSLNLAALDAAARVGQGPLLVRLRALGIRAGKSADHYGAAAVLGGLDVAPIDLAAAYLTLARGGTRVPLAYAPAAVSPGDRLLDPGAVEVTRDVLADARARADAFGADLVDLAGGRFALKTGTSSGFRDAWAAVFTDAVTIVVWLGDPASRPLGAVSGFEAAAPAAARILAAAKARWAAIGIAAPPRDPVELVPVAICAHTGLRPGPRCPHVVEERFARGTAPLAACESHDERGDLLLPARYAAWIERAHPPGVSRAVLAPPDVTAEVVVREPRDGARWLLDPARGSIDVPLRASVGGAEVVDASWEIDGAPLEAGSFRVTPGVHEVVAVWRGKRSRAARVMVSAAR